MKNLNYYFLTAFFFLVWITSGLTLEIGKPQPEYTVTWAFPIEALVLIGGSFFCGYMTRKTEKP